MKKIIANYFPQYHPIELNDKYWGEGFTDWWNVKKAKPLFNGHKIPKIPYNNVYYSLLDETIIDSQISLAASHNIHAFNFYHYWFDGVLLLDKPIEVFEKMNKKRLKYCLTWANESWTKQWVGSPEIIIEQKHLNKKQIWLAHLEFLIARFNDESYLIKENKPIFTIYRPELINNIQELIEFYSDYVRDKTRFDGIYWVGIKSYDFQNEENVFEKFNSILFFQPRLLFNSTFFNKSKSLKMVEKVLRVLPWKIQNILGTLKFIGEKNKRIEYGSFVKEQKKLISKNSKNPKIMHTLVVDWDNTARYGKRFKALVNYSHNLFKDQLLYALKHSKTDLIFLNAWNEWAESAILEPDSYYEYDRLKVIKKTYFEYIENLPKDDI